MSDNRFGAFGDSESDNEDSFVHVDSEGKEVKNSAISAPAPRKKQDDVNLGLSQVNAAEDTGFETVIHFKKNPNEGKKFELSWMNDVKIKFDQLCLTKVSEIPEVSFLLDATVPGVLVRDSAQAIVRNCPNTLKSEEQLVGLNEHLFKATDCPRNPFEVEGLDVEAMLDTVRKESGLEIPNGAILITGGCLKNLLRICEQNKDNKFLPERVMMAIDKVTLPGGGYFIRVNANDKWSYKASYSHSVECVMTNTVTIERENSYYYRYIRCNLGEIPVIVCCETDCVDSTGNSIEIKSFFGRGSAVAPVLEYWYCMVAMQCDFLYAVEVNAQKQEYFIESTTRYTKEELERVVIDKLKRGSPRKRYGQLWRLLSWIREAVQEGGVDSYELHYPKKGSSYLRLKEKSDA